MLGLLNEAPAFPADIAEKTEMSLGTVKNALTDLKLAESQNNTRKKPT